MITFSLPVNKFGEVIIKHGVMYTDIHNVYTDRNYSPIFLLKKKPKFRLNLFCDKKFSQNLIFE